MGCQEERFHDAFYGTYYFLNHLLPVNCTQLMNGVTPLWQVPDLNEKPYPKVTFFIQITLFVTFERYFEKFSTDTKGIYD